MAVPFDLVLRGGHCFTPGGCELVDIGVRAGKIACVANSLAGQGAEEVSCAGLVVLPGAIDTQVHFREPGLEHKEDFATGTASAALGGITAIFEMPNTSPPTTSAAALADKLRRAAGRTWVDHAFFVGASLENADELGQLERLPGCAGVKIFMGSSTGNLLVAGDDDVLRALMSGRRRVAVHCEDEARLSERKGLRETGNPATHPVWRDELTALRATERLLRLARQAQRPVHVLHVTTAEEMDLLAQHRDLATVEVTPQHLTLAAPECYATLGTRAQMNPPIRDERHRQALWAALRQGVVDVVGSDHAPHTLAEKARPYPESPSGMPGVQTLLPLLLDHVSAGRLTLGHVVDLVCSGPARVYGIASKGRISLGYDADFSVVDPKGVHVLSDETMASRVGWTPFAGRRLTGKAVMTIVRGQVVMRDGALQGSPTGAPVRFVGVTDDGRAVA